MRKRAIAIFVGATAIHDFATLYGIGSLWGLSLMHPSSVNPIEGKVWRTLLSILSLPILRIFPDSESFSIVQIYLICTLNSIVAMGICYCCYRLGERVLRSKARNICY
jgi:hypothetical protein